MLANHVVLQLALILVFGLYQLMLSDVFSLPACRFISTCKRFHFLTWFSLTLLFTLFFHSIIATSTMWQIGKHSRVSGIEVSLMIPFFRWEDLLEVDTNVSSVRISAPMLSFTSCTLMHSAPFTYLSCTSPTAVINISSTKISAQLG